MLTGTHIEHVVYDGARRRFIGTVSLKDEHGGRRLNVSAPGAATWSHRQIVRALMKRARAEASRTAEVRHAGL